MATFTFAVGIWEPRRRVTVEADTRNAATLKARIELDRRCRKSGREAPVAWDLELISVE
jgi:hypothetical protein